VFTDHDALLVHGRGTIGSSCYYVCARARFFCGADILRACILMRCVRRSEMVRCIWIAMASLHGPNWFVHIHRTNVLQQLMHHRYMRRLMSQEQAVSLYSTPIWSFDGNILSLLTWKNTYCTSWVMSEADTTV